MDAFFVSVELRRRPELAGLPVVVGGAGPRGVVAAASYEARRFGVFSAMPSAVARRRCPHAVFLQGDHAHYGEVSAEVRGIFDRYTPLVEPLSLDEAFLDVSGATGLFGPAPAIAHRIRREVAGELGLTCSVGVAPNKFLAKLASVEAKPTATPAGVTPGAGVVVVEPGAVRAFLDPLPAERLWGVGPVTLQRLHRIGVRTVADLHRLDDDLLVGALGAAQAAHLASLAAGDDDRPVEPDRDAKSIGHEETFATNVHDAGEVRRHVVRLADAVAQRLRRAGVGARTITLKARYDDGFRTITRSTTAAAPIDTAAGIVEALEPVLAALDPTPGLRLLGVSGSNLAAPVTQLSLLDDAGPRDAAAAAVDAIRERFGVTSIAPASTVERGAVRSAGTGAGQWGPRVEDRP
jgi:DNA polymerase-4